MDIKKRIIRGYRNRRIFHWAHFLFTLLFFIIIWSTDTESNLKVISALLFTISQWVYTFKIPLKVKKTLYPRNLYIIYLIFLSLITLAYIASTCSEFDIAGIALVVAIGLILVCVIINILPFFWKFETERDIPLLVITYLCFSFMIITLFSYGFIVLDGYERSKSFTDGSIGTLDKEYFLYASEKFYSTSITEMRATTEKARIFVLVEVVMSYTFHLIILSFIIQRIKPNRKKK